MNKTYLSANDLLLDSFQLGADIFNSGFRPTMLAGVWRGGTSVAIAVHEILDYLGVKMAHMAIQTISYTGIAQQESNIKVSGLDQIIDNSVPADQLLIVDDVFDTGRSLEAILDALKNRMDNKLPQEIRIATPWFKPKNNRTKNNLIPDFYLHETEDWLVFPHELDGLTQEEIFNGKPGLEEVFGAIQKTGM